MTDRDFYVTFASTVAYDRKTQPDSQLMISAGLRPNLMVDGNFFIFCITEAEGEYMVFGDKGRLTGTAVVNEPMLEAFVKGAAFELRGGPLHPFASGVIDEVISRELAAGVTDEAPQGKAKAPGQGRQGRRGRRP